MRIPSTDAIPILGDCACRVRRANEVSHVTAAPRIVNLPGDRNAHPPVPKIENEKGQVARFKMDAADDRSLAELTTGRDMLADRESNPNSAQGSARPLDETERTSMATQESIRGSTSAPTKELPPTGRRVEDSEFDPQATQGDGGSERRRQYLRRHTFALVAGLIFFISGSLILAVVTFGGFAASPSFELFGAFFPAWMLCTLIGIFGGVSARVLFVANGLAYVLPHQLAVCTAIGIIAAVFAWLIGFGW